MTKRIGLMLTAGVVLGFVALNAVAEDDLKKVEKAITKGWEKHQSVTAKMTMVMQHTGTTAAETKVEGTYELMKKKGKVLSRMELSYVMVQKVGDQEFKIEQQSTVIIDGQYAYTLTDVMGQKSAIKTKVDAKTSGDPASLLADLRKNDELKLLPEEKLDGQKVYVLQATPKDPSGNPIAKTVYYFLQDSGFPVKIVCYGTDGKPIQTTLCSEIKFDVDLKPERFVFKALPGVEVQDMTGDGKP